MDILLTNDDGISAIGLRSLAKSLSLAGHAVHVVAPISEMSAVGHAITLASPLRVKEFREDAFFGLGVSGTPADCVKLGLTTLLPKRPDLVVSGINAGANVGVDILYSGTVSAATEGALMGLPALAVSHDAFNAANLADQADWTARFIGRFPWGGLAPQRVINLNFPACALAEAKGVSVCPQTSSTYRDWYDARKDPRGRDYYWLCGEIPPDSLAPDSDRALLTEGHITLTALRFDFTDHETMKALRACLES